MVPVPAPHAGTQSAAAACGWVQAGGGRVRRRMRVSGGPARCAVRQAAAAPQGAAPTACLTGRSTMPGSLGAAAASALYSLPTLACAWARGRSMRAMSAAWGPR